MSLYIIFLFRYSLEILKLRKPTLDVCTRWNATYDMLKGLLLYQRFCNENLGKSSLTKDEWIKIQNIVTVLTPIYTATIQLQESQLLLTDFYKLWLNLKMEIESTKTSTAETLLDCLQLREDQILHNEILNAAIFLDPRIKRLLSREQKDRAKKHLKSVAMRMLSLKQVCIERKLKIGSFVIF